MADAAPALQVRPTRYVVTLVPESVPQWYLWSLAVEYRGRDLWVVLDSGCAVGRDGESEYEPSPSSRDDEFRASHYFDLDTALALAREHAPLMNINGLLPAAAIARAEARRG